MLPLRGLKNSKVLKSSQKFSKVLKSSQKFSKVLKISQNLSKVFKNFSKVFLKPLKSAQYKRIDLSLAINIGVSTLP